MNLPPDWKVPSYDVVRLRERRSRYAVVIPVLNEGDRIRRQLALMGGLPDLPDVVVADGGSTDGALTEDLLKSTDVRALLTKTGPGRLSAQLRMGLSWALTEGYEGVITIDGNGKDDPAAITLMVARLDAGDDFVQGSRFVPGGRGINTPRSRDLAIRLVHAPLTSMAARCRYTDTTNGFRAHSRRMLLDNRVAPFRDVFDAYELLAYLPVRAGQLGLRVSEVPVTRSYPAIGAVPTKISPVHGSLSLLTVLLRATTGRYAPAAAGCA